MLVLMQYPGESAIITCTDGTEIRVMVGRVIGNKVRMCYTAPREVIIDREKIHERKRKEREGE